jgi:signal transduction histidine kinase
VVLLEGLRLPGLAELTSALLVPFTGPGGAGGALLVGSEDGVEAETAALDEDDMEALRGFAAQAALGIDRAQAQEDRAALALVADRDRIARDLHDLVIQRLFATGLTLNSLAKKAHTGALQDQLTSVVDDLDATIQDIRGAIFELGREGGEGDLKSQVLAVASAATPMLRSIPQVEFSGPVNAAVPDTVRPQLLAVIVEALSNAGRHAAADVVTVKVSIDDTPAAAAVVVEISDDGQGFASCVAGNGMRNMRDRARDLDGAFDVVSRPGEGTTVRWVVPLPRE